VALSASETLISIQNEEKESSLLELDVLLPEQYLDMIRTRVLVEPEKALMLAVLEDAIANFRKNVFLRNSSGKALAREPENWIADKNRDNLFSFENICDFLDIDPDYLRRGLRLWKEEKTKELPRGAIVSFDREKKNRSELPVS
jgi:hypothetical protein